MRRYYCRAALTSTAALFFIAGSPLEATAIPFTFVSESAVFDAVTNEVLFSVEFNKPPDFFTTDSLGQPAHSFQYFIFGDRTLPYPDHFDSIIRGDEIRFTTDLLRIRDSQPPVADPVAGGWGPIRGSVPFSLDDNLLMFSVSLALISDHSLDGHFTYELMSTEFGAMTRVVQSQVPPIVIEPIPEPATFVLLTTGLAGLAYRRRR